MLLSEETTPAFFQSLKALQAVLDNPTHEMKRQHGRICSHR